MTKATVCLATAFCALFAMECSSSSSNNNDGGSSQGDSAFPVTVDANGTPLAAPPGGLCPGLPCSSGQKCCLNPLSMTGLCQDPSATCGGIVSDCSAPSDCMGSQVCCVNFGGGGGRGGSVSCMADSACMSMGGGGGFVTRLCDSTHACPTGSMCMQPPMMGGRGGGDGGAVPMFCFNPNMFGQRDAGSDTGAKETGAPDTGAVDTGAADTAAPDAGADTGSATDAGGG